MTISAKIIADSISSYGGRPTTMQLRYPRFIHAEELTHRVISTGTEMIETIIPDGFMYDKDLSRNASSSRAIPTTRLIADVERDPVIPIYWGKNQAGMQARGELSEAERTEAKRLWLQARDNAINTADRMISLGAHKQIVNRILEPFSHINVVVTATNYANFYALRRHEDAQPEIKALADAMWEAQQASTPKFLRPGEWHLPYVTEEDYRPLQMASGRLGIEWNDLAIRISVARCARVSYLTHEGKVPNIEEDLKLYDRLVAGEPLHASPAEHQATPDIGYNIGTHAEIWSHPKQCGNFGVGWRQYRKMLPNECVAG